MPPVTIRRASPDDYAAFTRLMPLLEVDDPIPTPEKWAREMVPDAWIAERDGEVVGYLVGQSLRPTAYVRNVVVAREAQGRGIGRALMVAFADHLRAAGIREWQLNVKPDNAPAIALYTALGMRRRYAATSLRFDWTLVDALPDADVRIEALGPEDDAAVEGATGVTPGLLADLRRRPGRVLLAAWRDATPVGVAAFDPAFPGAYPFRVTDPDVAGPLWRALRRHGRHPYAQTVVEDDPVTTERFLARGATVRLEIDHYVGPLPPAEGS